MSGPQRLALMEARQWAIEAFAGCVAAGKWERAGWWADRAAALDGRLRREVSRRGRSRE